MKKNFQLIVIYPLLKALFFLTFVLFLTNYATAQGGGLWQANGNTTVATSRIVEINNNAVIDSNLTVNKSLFVPSLISNGFSLVRINNNGRLENFSFTGNSNDVLLGNGTFSNIGTMTGWALNGNNLYNTNSGSIGIGTNNPQATLHVVGNAIITNGLLTSSLIISEKVQTERMEGDTVNATEARAERIGVGVINPVERLEVGGNAKIFGNLSATGIVQAGGLDINGPVSFDSVHVTGSLKVGNTIYLNPNIPPLSPPRDQILSSKKILVLGGIGDLSGNTPGPIEDYSNIKVGIGTTNPARSLHIKAITCHLCPAIPIPDDRTVYIRLEDEKQDQYGNFIDNHQWDIGASNDFFVRKVGGPLSFTITEDGNVGIGTATPQASLQIATVGNNAPDLAFKNNLGLPADILFYSNTTLSSLIRMDKDANGATWDFQDRQGSGSISRFYIDGNGIAYAKEIKVKLAPFPDYVFAKEYGLMPLLELEQYIKANKHLPGIPSASEVNENGIGIGDMQILLLQKVEELTLYVLELKKESELQKLLIEELRKN